MYCIAYHISYYILYLDNIEVGADESLDDLRLHPTDRQKSARTQKATRSNVDVDTTRSAQQRTGCIAVHIAKTIYLSLSLGADVQRILSGTYNSDSVTITSFGHTSATA